VWLQINGRWTATQQNINHRITHNGDFDGFLLGRVPLRGVNLETRMP
jgi:hypothetical protein